MIPINTAVQYRIRGMDCAEEVSLLRARLSRERGVRELEFDTFHARMNVAFDPALTTRARVEAAIRETGMDCEEWREGAAAVRPAGFGAHSTWISGLALLAGLAVQAAVTGELLETLLAHGHGEGGHHEQAPALAVACYALAVVAGLARIAPRAWASLRHRRPDMNLLVVASAAGAAGLGEWTEAASLSFLFSLAGRLESWSLNRAREAISGLLRVAPQRALVLHGGHEHEMDVAGVRVGSLVRVEKGARFPFDGAVVSGDSFVDQAIVTGESVAVPKGPGARVLAGTLNMTAPLVVETSTEARDTVLSRLICMVENSTHRKARREQRIDRFARFYTSAVLALAATVFLLLPLVQGAAWQQAAYSAMAVLLVACPCALVISTPITMMAAIASAARNGALIKGGAFLEEAARIRVIMTPRGMEAPPGIRLLEIPARHDAEGRQSLLERALLQDRRTAYLGSGPEDVAALQTASLGISVAASSSDAAQEAADVVLMVPGPPGLAFLIAHARRALRTVGVNIAIAVGLKLLFVAAALTGRASLWMAVASDMGATLLVTANALRLLRARRPAAAAATIEK